MFVFSDAIKKSFYPTGCELKKAYVPRMRFVNGFDFEWVLLTIWTKIQMDVSFWYYACHDLPFFEIFRSN